MKHIRTFQQLNEMAEISLKGRKALADGAPLKGMKLEQIDDNMLIMVETRENPFVPVGKFWLYFVDSPSVIPKMKSGEHGMLIFPVKGMFNAFTVSPIDDVWTKKYQKNIKGSEHIIGMIEGWVSPKRDRAIVQMLSVRPKFKHNRIASFMIDALKDAWPQAEFEFEDPTDDGYLFIKNYDPEMKLRWTNNFRPKEYKKDHPEEKN